MSFLVRPPSIVNQLLKDINKVHNSAAVESRTNSLLQGNAESFVTSESIGLGDPVIIRGDGLAESAYNKLAKTVVFGQIAEAIVYISSIDRIVAVGRGTTRIGRMSADKQTIVWGTAQTYEATTVLSARAAFIEADQRLVIAYRLNSGGYSVVSGIIPQVPGTEISFGTVITPTTGALGGFDAIYSSSLDKILVAYTLDSDDTGLFVQVITLTAVTNTVAAATPILVPDTIGGDIGTSTAVRGYEEITISYLEQRNLVVLAATFDVFGFLITVVGSINTTTNTGRFGQFVPLIDPPILNSGVDIASVYDPINERIIFFFSNFTFATLYLGMIFVGQASLSDDRMVMGAAFPYAYEVRDPRPFVDIASGKVIVPHHNAAETNMYIATFNVNAELNTITMDSNFIVVEGTAQQAVVTYDSTNDRIVYFGGGSYKVFHVTSSPFRPQFQYIGMANESRGEGEVLTVTMFGVNDKQTALTPGTTYYVGDTALQTATSTIKA